MPDFVTIGECRLYLGDCFPFSTLVHAPDSFPACRMSALTKSTIIESPGWTPAYSLSINPAAAIIRARIHACISRRNSPSTTKCSLIIFSFREIKPRKVAEMLTRCGVIGAGSVGLVGEDAKVVPFSAMLYLRVPYLVALVPMYALEL